jgi:hypothetical protein
MTMCKKIRNLLRSRSEFELTALFFATFFWAAKESREPTLLGGKRK